MRSAGWADRASVRAGSPVPHVRRRLLPVHGSLLDVHFKAQDRKVSILFGCSCWCCVRGLGCALSHGATLMSLKEGSYIARLLPRQGDLFCSVVCVKSKLQTPLQFCGMDCFLSNQMYLGDRGTALQHEMAMMFKRVSH
jgi:hypothetical protein